MNKLFDKIESFIGNHIKNKRLRSILKKLFSKEMLQYLFFGVLTTVVNLVCFNFLEKRLGSQYSLITNIIAWVVAVLFAFFTNKFFVFNSKSMKLKTFSKELASFTGARLLSLGVEELGLLIAQFVFSADEKSFSVFSFNISAMMMTKIILAIIVVILNYIFSKLFVFKKNK